MPTLHANPQDNAPSASLLDEARAIMRAMSEETEQGRQLASREAETRSGQATQNELRRQETTVPSREIGASLKA